MNTLVWSDETFMLQESSRRKLSVNKDDLSDCAKKGIAGKLLQKLITSSSRFRADPDIYGPLGDLLKISTKF